MTDRALVTGRGQGRTRKPRCTPQNRPLKSKTQLAEYRHFVLTHVSKLPKGTARPVPSKVTPGFLASNRQIPKLDVSGAGIDFTQSGCGCTPPDQAIATNGTQVFEGVNNLLEAYSTALGTVYGPFTAQAFFGPVFHSGDSFSDPQITYNATKKRWLVSWLEITPSGGGAPDYIDLAVSSTSAINSAYYEYQIPSSASGATFPRQPRPRAPTGSARPLRMGHLKVGSSPRATRVSACPVPA